MKVSMVIFKLLFLGALFIISNQDLHLIDSSERGVFIDSYSSWLSTLFLHGREVTSFVVKFEWLPPKDMGGEGVIPKTDDKIFYGG